MKELDWIEYLRKRIKTKAGVLRGIGDDCALVKLGKQTLLLKSDLFIEDIHFRLKRIDFKTIGMRAVARVLSDFAASGGSPKFIGVSIGVASYIREKNLKEILNGILILSRKFKFSLVGGDTSRSAKLFLDVWGVAEAKKSISRSTARIGDFIFISGRLGKNRLNTAFNPRLRESQFLVRNFKINSMIDISDGFILDLYRILTMSNKGALVYSEKVPCCQGESDWYRGEDYELIFTVDKSEKRIELLRKKFYCIGEIKSKSFGYKVKRLNKLYKASLRGYQHF